MRPGIAGTKRGLNCRVLGLSTVPAVGGTAGLRSHAQTCREVLYSPDGIGARMYLQCLAYTQTLQRKCQMVSYFSALRGTFLRMSGSYFIDTVHPP